jgi:CheY-like chemotaxis protein
MAWYALRRAREEIQAARRAEKERVRREEAEARREEAQRDARAKDEFLATLAHELRNPLAPIVSSVAILGMERAAPGVAAQARAIIERQTRHLVRLVDDLLDLSRVTRGKVELRRERVEVSALVEQALEICRGPIEAAGHALNQKLPPAPIFVHGDPVRLVQVLSNVLTNAERYTTPGGRITLDVRKEGRDVSISIEDSGIGIAPEMLDRVFDPFVRADNSLERARGGLGIGLTLARQLVELHGGTIEAASEGPGHGSRFTIRLPLAEAASTGESAKPLPKARAERLQHRKILVVDDNVDAAQSVAALLAAHGCEVATVHDGLAALAAAQTFSPEAVLLDIGMPGMNGYAVCKALRATARGADMTIVALTGWGQDADRQKSDAAGFDAHLVKPAGLEHIVDVLATKQRAATERRHGKDRRH